MNKKKSTSWIFPILVYALLLICAGIWLGSSFSNSLSYREQQQLFMNDGSYLASLFWQVGGLATLCARFLVQLFWSKAAALGITVILLGLVLYFGRKTFFFNLLIAVYLCVAISDNNLHYDALLAVVIAFAALQPVDTFKKAGLLIYGICMSVLLFFFTGYGALVFAVGLILRILHKKDKGLALVSCASLCSALLSGLISVQSGLVPTVAKASSPKLFYEASVEMPAIPLGTAMQERECMYELLAEAEDWVGLMEKAGENASLSPADANYYRLACAEKGELLDNLFIDNNFGPDDLVNFPSDYLTTARIARIMYSMGNMASAQCVAFNLAQATSDYCPGMFKMLAKIELMRGCWPLAEKYLYILSRSPHYRSWAERMMNFVGDDAAVEADPELSRGRKGFPSVEGFVQTGRVAEEQLRVVEANPEDARAMEWLMGYMLLTKDVAGLFSLVDRYYGTAAMPKVPKRVQEAMIMFAVLRESLAEEFSEEDALAVYDVDWCLAHGVAREVQRRFGVFMDSASLGPEAAAITYGNTAWYYILFVRGDESI